MAITSFHGSGARAGSSAGFQLQLESDFSAVRHAAAQIRAFLQRHGVLEEDVWACELAFVEGCNNAVQHAPEAGYTRQLLIEITCQKNEAELRIEDYGAGFAFPERVDLPPSQEEHGRGLYLMKTLMDQVEYLRHETGNCLVLKKKLNVL